MRGVLYRDRRLPRVRGHDIAAVQIPAQVRLDLLRRSLRGLVRCLLHWGPVARHSASQAASRRRPSRLGQQPGGQQHLTKQNRGQDGGQRRLPFHLQ